MKYYYTQKRLDEITDLIDRWHFSDYVEDKELHEFLNMSEEEYSTYVECRFIVKEKILNE